MKYNLQPFSKDNNRFVSVFHKLLKGEGTREEIEFAKQYALEFVK